MDYITWPMKVTGNYDLSYLELIEKLTDGDRLFLLDLTQVNYFPLDHSPKDDLSDTLYHLSKIKTDKKIFYVNSDIDLQNNIKKFNVNISSIVYPWFSLLQGTSFYTFPEFSPLYGDSGSKKRYKLITLCRNRKFHRYYYLNEMIGQDGFVYSNLGFYSGDKLDADIVRTNKVIKEVRLIKNSEFIECVYDDGYIKKIIPSEVNSDIFAGSKFNSEEIKTLTEITTDKVIDCLYNLGCYITKDKHKEGLNHFFCVPQEFKESYVNIILESRTNIAPRFSDKLFKSIYFEIPFLILGPKNIHKRLKEYGFKLYDFFDYDFDNKSFDIRMKSVIEQSKHICSLSLQELNLIYERNYSKILHNKKIIINIIEEEFHKKITDNGIPSQGNRGTTWEYLNESKTRLVKLEDNLADYIFNQNRINELCLEKC